MGICASKNIKGREVPLHFKRKNNINNVSQIVLKFQDNIRRRLTMITKDYKFKKGDIGEGS